jgi:hypothetical protein
LFVPATNQPATTSAFGVIFSDVDDAGSAHVDFFDEHGTLIFGQDVLPSGGNGMFSFLGITLDSSLIRRVRITSGSATIASNGVLGAAGDLVAMDDFIYAEPAVAATVPEPSPLALAMTGLALLTLVKLGGSASQGVSDVSTRSARRSSGETRRA